MEEIIEKTKREVISEFENDIPVLFEEKLRAGLVIGPLPAPDEMAVQLIRAHAIDATKIKLTERHHQNDYDREEKRIYNGKEAEWVLRIYLKLPPPDLTVGPSTKHNVADVVYRNQRIGVKSSQLTNGNAAMVHKVPKRPEIIMVKNENGWYIFGVGTIEVMKNNQDIRLLKTAYNDSKAGLTIDGYRQLIPFDTFLRELV